MLVIAITNRHTAAKTIGALMSSAAFIAGVGTVVDSPSVTGTGMLLAQPSVVDGAGNSGNLVAGSGALVSAASTLSGAGVSKSTGTGSLASQSAAVAGAGGIPVVTSYDNWGGKGNRSHLIDTSYSGITGGCGSDYGISLVDGSKTSGSCITSTAWGNTNTAAVLKFDMRAGNEKVIDEFKWFQDDTASHGTWNFAGSNDAAGVSGYTDLKVGFTLGGATESTYSFTNTNGYRWFKLYQTGGTTSSSSWLEEIEFKLAPADAAAPSYDNAGGKGDRHLIITGSYSGISGGCGSNFAQPLVDGSFVSDCATATAWGAANTAGVLKFHLSSAKVVNEFSWYQDINATHGTWSFAGSNDDGSYTDLATGLTLGVTNSRKGAAFPFANTTAYEWYKLYQTGGTTSSASWNHEIEFKIGT